MGQPSGNIHAPQPGSAGRPFGFVSPDGVPKVVYEALDGSIIEIYAMPGQAWQWDSLSGKVGAPAAGSAPMGYVTGEGTPDWAARVVYQALDGYIVEMYLTPGQP